MSETSNSTPELSWEEDLKAAWDILEQEPSVSQYLDEICLHTISAADERVLDQLRANDQEVRNLWKTAIVTVSTLCAKPWRCNEKPAATEVLSHSLSVMSESIHKYGWVIPGVSFKIVEEGFEWIEEAGRELEDRMFDVIDLRDMDKPAPLVDMTQEEFNSLSEEEVELLRVKVNENLTKKLFGKGLNYSLNVPKRQTAMYDAFELRVLIKRRRFGVPDRELSREDVTVYVTELIVHRKENNPTFGSVPEDYKLLPERIKTSIQWLFDYFMHIRDPLQQEDAIDTYSLKSTIGLKNKQINELVDNGVLQPHGSYQGPDGGLYGTYRLARPYHEYWWVNSVIAREIE